MVAAGKPVAIACATCGSPDVSRDAWAEWDVAKQDWALRAVFDAAHCHICDSDDVRLAAAALSYTPGAR